MENSNFVKKLKEESEKEIPNKKQTPEEQIFQEKIQDSNPKISTKKNESETHFIKYITNILKLPQKLGKRRPQEQK